jgi:hypothetical protein
VALHRVNAIDSSVIPIGGGSAGLVLSAPPGFEESKHREKGNLELFWNEMDTF